MERKENSFGRLTLLQDMRSIAFCIIVLLTMTKVYCQEPTINSEPGWNGRLEIAYLRGFGKINYNGSQTLNRTYMVGLRVSVNKELNQNDRIGFGIGLDGYHNGTRNTLPIFVNYLRNQYLARIQTEFEQKIGFSPKSDTFQNGLFCESSFGLRIPVKKKAKLLIALTYKLQQIHDDMLYLITIDPGSGITSTELLVDDILLHNAGFKISWNF